MNGKNSKNRLRVRGPHTRQHGSDTLDVCHTTQYTDKNYIIFDVTLTLTVNLSWPRTCVKKQSCFSENYLTHSKNQVIFEK